MNTNHMTEFSSLLSGIHGRERRQERNIEKIDLQRAKKYGMQESTFKGRLKFTYGGIVFIYDPIRRREITSFPSRDAASESTGTKFVVPVLLPRNKVYETETYINHNKKLKSIIQADMTMWKSHAVFVVDMSGSMRRDDVSGARCRSDGVWLVLAKDFVKKQLDTGTASECDIVSIILMRDTAEVVLQFEPLSWILYNKLIDMREWDNCRPSGPGNYLPALVMAEELLAANSLGTCALSLLFFSDGKPSDHGPFAAKMGEIASKYRRRLTFSCIGMAQDGEDEVFETLNDMVTEADAYGAKSSFSLPSLDTESLSNIISSMSSSLTTTKTEMTDVATGQTKVVRHDVRSERKGTIDDLFPTDEWRMYNNTNSLFVVRIWSWSSVKDDFIYLKDTRCHSCWEECMHQVTLAGKWCPECKAVGYCLQCIGKLHQHTTSRECQFYLKDSRSGRLASLDVPSFSVAMKEPIFGEGAERVVRKFRFLNSDFNFIGPKMVAKESRFIDPSGGSYRETRAFHADFMRTQALASEFATKFNQALDSLWEHFVQPHAQEMFRKLPRIEFVEPMVVEVQENNEESNILIERFLEGKYEKFNNNMGFVQGQSQKVTDVDDLAKAFDDWGLNNLGDIQEESDEEESDDEIFDPEAKMPDSGVYSSFKDQMVPQTFSHYSFDKSKRRFLVVDLQGVFEKNSDGSQKYVLTDPAIHKNTRRKHPCHEFGRTDRGKVGMKAFFDTHECTDVCRLLGLEKVDPKWFCRRK